MYTCLENCESDNSSALVENGLSVENPLEIASIRSEDAHDSFNGKTELDKTTNCMITVPGNNETLDNSSITQIRMVMNNGKSRGFKRRRAGTPRDDILSLLRCELEDENLVQTYIRYYDDYEIANGNTAIEDSILLKAFASNIKLKKKTNMTIFQIGSQTYKLIIDKLNNTGTAKTIIRKPLGNGKQLNDADFLNFRLFFETIPLSTSFIIQDKNIKSYKALKVTDAIVKIQT